MEKSTVRVLVVDDFEPFRRFICSTLEKRSELQIVGEVSDGLEAVHRAKEAQPDLIVLDIGLPTLNGFEAARRIRKLSPKSKILFVSQESSQDALDEALRVGALGYVVKSRVGRELPLAVDAVLQGIQFISSGLSGCDFTGLPYSKSTGGVHSNAVVQICPEIIRNHQVEFYADDSAFAIGFTRYIEAALKAGEAVVVVSTDIHLESIFQRLQEREIDIAAAIEQGRFLTLDVAEALSVFMGSDLPDPILFLGVVGDLIARAAQTTGGNQSKVAICGECASILWAQGKADAAIRLEYLCNQVTRQYGTDILCGFSLDTFYRDEDRQVFEKICSEC